MSKFIVDAPAGIDSDFIEKSLRSAILSKARSSSIREATRYLMKKYREEFLQVASQAFHSIIQDSNPEEIKARPSDSSRY